MTINFSGAISIQHPQNSATQEHGRSQHRHTLKMIREYLMQNKICILTLLLLLLLLLFLCVVGVGVLAAFPDLVNVDALE